ncbi:MAG: sugar transporter, partial [Deltaproteobacteria bacterium]
MPTLIKFLKIIDWLSEKSGQLGKWAVLLLIFAGSYEA